MSESVDFIKKFENLIKEQPILEAKIIDLRNQVKSALEELDKIDADKNGMLNLIKLARETTKDEINKYRDTVNKTLDKERFRLAEEAVEQARLVKTNYKKTQKLKQYENELDDKKQKNLELDNELKHLKIDLDMQSETICVQQDEIAAGLQRIEREKRNNSDQLKSINSIQVDNEIVNKNIVDDRKDIKTEQNRLKEWETRLIEKNKKVKEDEDKLLKLNNESEDNQKVNKLLLKTLSENQKNLNDKETSLNALKMDIDFKIAKLKTQGVDV